MNAHPNDRYYTVAEVQQAKNFRADMRQFLKDSAPDWILSGETRAVIEVGGRFRHVPGRRRMSWVSTEAVARGKIAFDQAMDEYLNRKRFEGMFGEPNPSGQPCLANETEDKPFDMSEMAKTIAELSDIKRDPYGRVISANQGTAEEIQALRDATVEVLASMDDSGVRPDYSGEIAPEDIKRQNDRMAAEYGFGTDLWVALNSDPIRKTAFDEAMAKFSGRKGLRHYMTPEQIRYVDNYEGPVVLGDPEWERIHAQAKPFPKAMWDTIKDLTEGVEIDLDAALPDEVEDVDPESRLYWPHTDVMDDELFEILCGPWPELAAVEGRSILDDDNAHLHGEVLEFFARPQRMTDDLWEQMTADERDLDDDHPGMDETEYLLSNPKTAERLMRAIDQFNLDRGVITIEAGEPLPTTFEDFERISNAAHQKSWPSLCGAFGVSPQEIVQRMCDEINAKLDAGKTDDGKTS